MIFGWRKRNEGFEWKEYVRTQILARRQNRRQKLIAAKVVAVEGAKEAGRRSVAAGETGLGFLRWFGSNIWVWIVSGARNLIAWVGRATVTAVGILANAFMVLRDAIGQNQLGRGLWERLGALFRRPNFAFLVLRHPEDLYRLMIAGAGLSAAGLLRVAGHGMDLMAVVVLLTGGVGLVSALVWLGKSPLDFAARWGESGLRLPDIAWPDGEIRAWLTRGRLLIMGGIAASLGALVLAWGYLPSLSSWNFFAPEIVRGRASAVSGDVLRVAGREIALAGIEAPEKEQDCPRPGNKRVRCGTLASQALTRLVRGRVVSCDVSGENEVGRSRGRCRAGAVDVAAELVRRGHVFTAEGAYGDIETSAQTAKAGIWAGDVQRPAEFRSKRWEDARRTAPEGCPIKGQVTTEGRVYVLPWGEAYDRLKVRLAKGERWFCTEEEARTAGWKRL